MTDERETVAWRYKRLGRVKWNVTNNPELIEGLSAKGHHTVEALGVIHELSPIA